MLIQWDGNPTFHIDEFQCGFLVCEFILSSLDSGFKWAASTMSLQRRGANKARTNWILISDLIEFHPPRLHSLEFLVTFRIVHRSQFGIISYAIKIIRFDLRQAFLRQLFYFSFRNLIHAESILLKPRTRTKGERQIFFDFLHGYWGSNALLCCLADGEKFPGHSRHLVGRISFRCPVSRAVMSCWGGKEENFLKGSDPVVKKALLSFDTYLTTGKSTDHDSLRFSGRIKGKFMN